MALGFDSTTLFRRVIEPENGGLPPEVGRYALALDFRPDDHVRYETLSAKAQDGTLTPAEAEELDGFLHVDSLLAILRLKAERSLSNTRT